MGPDNRPPPFDEEAALAELEKLREDIQVARRHREKKVEEFETWMRETRNTARVERIAAIEEETAGLEPAAAARSANRGTDPATQTSGLAAAPAVPSTTQRTPLDDQFPFEAPRSRGRKAVDPRLLYYGGGLAALVITATMLGRVWSNGSAAPSPSSDAQPAAGAASPAAAPGGNATPAPAVPRKPLEIELTTTRPVWMRVTVDGERRVEREVPAGQRLPFGADRVIVLRVGDGGGVRLAVGGKDQGLLGRDGQIAVRTLTK